MDRAFGNVADGTRERTLNFASNAEVVANYLTFAAWSSDGTWVAAARRGGVVTIWNADTGARFQTLDFSPRDVAPSPDSPVLIDALAFSEDKKLLAASSYDGTIRVAQTRDGPHHAQADGFR